MYLFLEKLNVFGITIQGAEAGRQDRISKTKKKKC